MSYYETFARLHQAPTPLLLGNCWDVHSARVLEAAGYKAVGFSSHALSTVFGYADGENLPFEILLSVAQKVVGAINVPFTVDMEGGFSRSIEGILAHIDQLYDAGVAGVNIEDTIPAAAREFLPAKDFAKIIAAIANHLSRNNYKLFLNIRTDAFLLDIPTALAETLTRIRIYADAGASGIFVPCITNRQDIEEVVQATDLPINVMCMPALPGFDTLGQLGVKRISMGPFLFSKVYDQAAMLAKQVLTGNDFTSILS